MLTWSICSCTFMLWIFGIWWLCSWEELPQTHCHVLSAWDDTRAVKWGIILLEVAVRRWCAAATQSRMMDDVPQMSGFNTNWMYICKCKTVPSVNVFYCNLNICRVSLLSIFIFKAAFILWIPLREKDAIRHYVTSCRQTVDAVLQK